MDTRNPNEIFATGFRAWGDNTNIHAHVSGESCVNRPPAERDSAFVSTGADFTYMRTAAIARAYARPGQQIYLYRIRADRTFYNAENSLRRYHGQIAGTTVAPANYLPARQANEYITPNEIPPENIESAESYVVVDQQLVVTQPVANPSYQPRDTAASDLPYPGDVTDRTWRPTWIGMLPVLGACLSPGKDELKSVPEPGYFTLEAILYNRVSNLNRSELLRGAR